MTLITSISGIRGTIGGKPGENLTPLDAVTFASAYGSWLRSRAGNPDLLKVVIGRDARKSGPMISELVINTLIGMGIDVIDLGLSTTPTVAIAVPLEQAQGGIIITASHNPGQWNALKLLNEKGEFIDGTDGAQVLEEAEKKHFEFSQVTRLGERRDRPGYMDIHVEEVLKLNLVDPERIREKNFKVVVDAVNSTGGIAVPLLLERLGVEVVPMYCTPNGDFPHNPEPLKEHLGDICGRVLQEGADMGIVVDPDVDRLVFVDEKGELFGEEYTLVACADYVLGHQSGNTVSNLSSTRALKVVTEQHGGQYSPAAVGEVNVVKEMKRTAAVIGGEGNGGVIYPDSHYGRDALVGIALFLMLVVERGQSLSSIRSSYPAFFMSKKKIQLTPDLDTGQLLDAMFEKYRSESISRVDGVKIDFEEGWVHMRKSNTEPIIRVYTEGTTQFEADRLADRFLAELDDLSSQQA